MSARHQGSAASDYYFVRDDRNRRLYYSRVTHQRIARKNIDPVYVDDVLDKHLDPLDTAKRFGGAWFLDDETGRVSKEPPPNYDPITWAHSFHVFAGRMVVAPRIIDCVDRACNGYMFVSNSRRDTQHTGGTEIFFDADWISRQYFTVVRHNAGG